LVLIGGVGHAESEVMSAVQRLGLADRVTRLGRVPALERDALIAASDLVVVPSEEEGFGAPVLEAMAAGTPVVASRIGALAEVVGDAGVLVERDVDALVDAIRLVLSDPEPWSVRGRDRAREFTIEISGSALHDAYREAIDRGSR
jgi:glycosyltransferase involved in cell wall biosynthesis